MGKKQTNPIQRSETELTPETLETNPVHLGVGATAEVEPDFTGKMEWYQGYVERHAEDGTEARLVAQHTFTEDWDEWEMHPNGEEVVICVQGAMKLYQELPDGSKTKTTVAAGQYAINPRGAWHTTDVLEGPAKAVFITAGVGTQHRPRKDGEAKS